MRPAIAIVTLLSAVSLVGCVPNAEVTPTTSPSATPSPSASADPVVDTIVVGADSFIMLAGDTELDRVSADDTDATVAGLTEALGPPVTTENPEGDCTTAFTEHRWGEAISITDRDIDLLGDYSARVFESEYVSTVSGSSVSITGPGGERVGDDISAFIAASDPAQVETSGSSAIVILEQGWASSGFVAGVAAFTDGGVINNVGMPIGVNTGGDC